MKTFKQMVRYFIEPEGSTTVGVTVECEFWAESAKTIIHHDSEATSLCPKRYRRSGHLFANNHLSI